ncbi:PREDICTED: melanoma-associated antigen B10-like [Galeopterus variegatus]|uniref:Melanoma-associated antigen B10-like n=1 Tax=Galeopterus variegatus TaxID=482537 RepID=A0ABM0Q3J6_GALVR|nr:PREDICTED: melanoma-associated antigen B10-like [Galeopterus variegatus]
MLVCYLLNKYQNKEPITKADMLRNVIQTDKKLFPEILKRASKDLELLFGLDLKEVDPNRNLYSSCLGVRRVSSVPVRNAARLEKNPRVFEGAEASVAEEEKSISSSSPHFKENPQRSCASGKPCDQQKPGKAPSSTAAAAAASSTRSHEGATSQVEEKQHVSQAQASTENRERSPVGNKAPMLVCYLLNKYQNKEPITKADMLRNVIQMDKKHFPETLKRASKDLELLFGLDLKEVDHNRNLYVLINKLKLSCDAKVNDNTGLPKTGLLMTVLAVIFSRGNYATEKYVWEVLNMMGVYDGQEHFICGEPRKLLTVDWVKEQYLEYRQVPNRDPPRYQFLWGPRAYDETSKMKVLEFWAKIHQTVPSDFPNLYAEALRDEEQRARARVVARVHAAAMARARSRAVSSSFSCPKVKAKENS